eukprot:205755-Amphidinium_carterae.2
MAIAHRVVESLSRALIAVQSANCKRVLSMHTVVAPLPYSLTPWMGRCGWLSSGHDALAVTFGP